jgi:hypothetical protein
MSKKDLAKIYYQNREVNHINIEFSNLSHKIDITPVVDISGKDQIIRMDYSFHQEEKEELPVCFWDIEDGSDKIQVNHLESGLMIEWLSNEGNIKSNLFIPMSRILHINIDDPVYDDEPDIKKEIIDR